MARSQLNTRVDDEQRERVREMAEERGISMSQAARRVITTGLQTPLERGAKAFGAGFAIAATTLALFSLFNPVTLTASVSMLYATAALCLLITYFEPTISERMGVL